MSSSEFMRVFLDGSVHAQSKIGVGAYLIQNDSELIEKDINTVIFKETSSTKLELQILNHTLKEILGKPNKIIVYTDSQNSVGLLGRREKLEAKNFKNKKGELLKNHDLYREFYSIYDQLNVEIIKIKGHKRTAEKDELDRVFSLVDKASRKALREIV